MTKNTPQLCINNDEKSLILATALFPDEEWIPRFGLGRHNIGDENGHWNDKNAWTGVQKRVQTRTVSFKDKSSCRLPTAGSFGFYSFTVGFKD